MNEAERLEKLETLAEDDPAYLVWKRSYEEFQTPFREYADAQPEEIRNMLWGYAEAGRLMCQRKLSLACAYMDFLKK